MRLFEFEEKNIIPKKDGSVQISKFFDFPITKEIAENKLLKVLNTPILRNLIDSSKEKDLRPEIYDYLSAEFPTLLYDVKKEKFNNKEGIKSPVGSPDISTF